LLFIPTLLLSRGRDWLVFAVEILLDEIDRDEYSFLLYCLAQFRRGIALAKGSPEGRLQLRRSFLTCQAVLA